ncbi:tripeptidyl-peptidase 2 [Frankliniella occidentalis]|uniref:Tripeptidyl-peptidase 2 n=1 Tax=Frankliniella occidentalis TaxID=133901 RepID=A0A6J1SG07_FRAOC|nr:tripeptidyl-peptidase 2 [Frankliniella occidentalis]
MLAAAKSVVVCPKHVRAGAGCVLFNDFRFASKATPVAMALIDTEFPVSALLPKKETGVTSFLAKYPEYDGRGITIAILDSGIDPGAPGLQVTTTGEKKLVEVYDCSGAGDVDISTIVKVKDGQIVGLTGRTLKIPTTWKNPTGNYHIGVKNAYELYTSSVRERIAKDKKEKHWDPAHKLAAAEATRKCREFEKEHPQESSMKPLDKMISDDLEAQVEVLTEADKKYSSPGPAYDCVVFNDGDVWRACIDTSCSGDLASCKVVGEYSKTYDYAQLTPSDQFNYAVNVWDEGKILEIVGMCSSHGTHVAAIAAANFPDEPEKNGVAPGAQVISLCIGDLRLSSMETGTAMTRAMIRVIQNNKRKIHVMNMSYGEHPHYSTSGRVIDMINDVIDKYGPVWVCSAGNEGPALSTISTPPNVNANTLIGVGAYVSPEMMVAEYSLRQKLPGTSTTWTSRGPTPTGDPGVNVCAPGAAITSVPQFMLRNCMLMNGTSMASPHVCGVVALLLSGMVQRNLPYTPYSVKRALENSAQFIDSQDKFGQGEGLVQVEKTFDHLATYHNQPERNVRFHLTCGNQMMRGIYLRDAFRDKPEDIVVKVDPVFFKSSSLESYPERTNFNMNLILTCDKPWVSHPSHLCLMNMSRTISIRIDPTSLPTGVHTTSVKAYDSSCVEKGPVFRIPITLVQPHVFPADQEKKELVFTDVVLKPSQMQRHYILVPENATWAVIKLLANDKCNVRLHTLQLRPRKTSKSNQYHKSIQLIPSIESVHSFAVKGGIIMEVVVAKFWTDMSESGLNYSVTFHGIKPDRSDVIMQATQGILSMDLYSGPISEELAPSASLRAVVSVCKPIDAKVGVLSPDRDMIPDGRQIYELQLTYTFQIKHETDVTICCPFLSHLLYESEYESQLWMLFSSSKKYICSGDAYSDSASSIKLDKGEYTLRMHVRHERKDLLEKLNDKPMLVSQKLSSVLTLDIYGTEQAAITGGRQLSGHVLHKNQILPVYIAPITNDKKDRIAKAASLGQYLSGSISYAKDELGKKACVYPLRYILPEITKSSSSSNKSSSAEKEVKNGASSITLGPVISTSAIGTSEPSTSSPSKDSKDKSKMKGEDYNEALQDFKIGILEKLERGEHADALYEELRAANPQKLSIAMAMLKNLKSSWDKSPYPIMGDLTAPCGDPALLNRVLTLVSHIIENADQNAVLAHYGTKVDLNSDAAKVKSHFDQLKNTIIEAYVAKGIVLCCQYLLNSDLEKDSKEIKDKAANLVEIDCVRRELLKFVDQKDSTIQIFLMWHAALHGFLGRLIRLILNCSNEKPSKELDRALVAALRSNGWDYWANHIEESSHVRFPLSYRLF